MKLFVPVKICCERDAVILHQKELCNLGSKAMIVTGKHSSSINGSLADVEHALNSNSVPYVIFNKIEENPSVETVAKAASIAIAEEVDFFIGIGGGSPMDAAKAISLLAKNPDLLCDPYSSLYEPSEKMEYYPIAEVPTTSGTGSEVTQYSILTQHNKHTKKSIAHHIFADLALVDAEYLHTSSFETVKNTCVDALAHLLESYLNTNSNELNRVYAREGLRLWAKVKDKLLSEDAFQSMSNEDYELFMRASVFGGMAIAHTGTSLPHGLSYPITYELGVPHGKALGIFLPAFLRYYENQEEVADILTMLGFIEKEKDASGINKFSDYIRSVLGHVEIPDELRKKDIEAILSNPAKLKNYPYPIDETILNKYYN